MRDKDYRRRQEAAHFIKRLKFYSIYKPDEYAPRSNGMMKRKDPVEIDDIKDERWVNKLKNGDVKFKWMDKWNKRFCDKVRRNLQKTVDYQLKPHRWYDRKHVNAQAKGYPINDEEYE